MLKRAVAFSLLILMAGCATAPQEGARFAAVGEMKPGYSLLYLYRPNEYYWSAVWPEVFLNEVKTVGLVNEGYTYVYLKPGSYRIRTEKCHAFSGMTNIPGAVTIEPDRVYYLLLDRKHEKIGLSLYRPVHERWTLIERDEALSEIRRLRYIKPYVEYIEP